MSELSQRREEEKEERRAEIVAAAEAVYADVGWDAATIDQVARRARLSRALVYVYFKYKQDLHLAIVERALEDLRRRFQEAARTPATGIAKVEAIGRAYVQYSREVPYYFDACSQFQAYQAGEAEVADPNEEACLSASRQVHGVLVEAIRAGMQDGSIRPDLGDPLMTAIALWGFAHGIIQLATTKAEMLGKFDIEIDSLMQHAFGLMTASLLNRI
jgi:TetR/AcrR family transcriptional regulator